MNNLDFLNNYSEPVCAFSNNNKVVFRNKAFTMLFDDCTSLERFKNRFNFSLCFLSSESNVLKTPIDILLEAKENFHTICTYQNKNDEYITYYIYTFTFDKYLIVVFNDITEADKAKTAEKRYDKLKKQYDEVLKSTEKFAKLQEHAQAQVLKMAIINRISLIIRENNDIETILSSALEEINNLLGAYKTYYSIYGKNGFKIAYSPQIKDIHKNTVTRYEDDVLEKINNKDISVSACLKEYLNSEDILQKGIKRIIIPVYNKNKLIGIIVSLTKQKINIEENREILQSISVQLASSVIQAELIEQLNKKNNKLEKTLSELKNTQMQLINTEKMASIGQLVSGVAHEINTPLASISSNNALISRILSKNEVPDINQMEILKELNSIDIEAANRISDIVKSLKRFVRLDEAQFQEADINSELDLTLKLITHETKNNIQIIKDYGKIPPVMCSVNMLNQVFMNLLVNACHSIQEKQEQGTITISTSVKDNNLSVKIKDTGCGMSDETKNKIFTAGYTTKKAGIGTGLGLSISKKIVELHKGSITFNSEQGKGSEFIVSIPVTNTRNN